MRFVRDDDAVTLAVVHAEMQDAGVFAGPEHDAAAPLVGSRFEMMAARFIAAMLAPLRVERVQLDDDRFAPEPFGDARQLVVAQRDVGVPQTPALTKRGSCGIGGCCCSDASACSTAERALACISSVRP